MKSIAYFLMLFFVSCSLVEEKKAKQMTPQIPKQLKNKQNHQNQNIFTT